MSRSGASRSRLGTWVLVALWIAAMVSFFVSAPMGRSAFHVGQALSGLCIVVAGLLVAYDWMGVATAMGERSARRWRNRLSARQASDPVVAARSARMLAWWWLSFGVLLVLFALVSSR
jgi:hypothetical protein